MDNTFKETMNHPDWDYWLYEDLGDQRYIGIHHGKSLSENDIRNEEYDLDVEKWCRKSHWTPQEAALIFFYRDPDKVERTEDDFIFHNGVYGPIGSDDKDGERNIQLRQHIIDLYEMIVEAQKARHLPNKVRRDVYIEWAKDVGVSIPTPILEALKAFDEHKSARESEEENTNFDQPEGLSQNESKASEKKNGGQPQRAENNTLRILLAVLIESNLIDETTFEEEMRPLARRLATFLERRKIKQTNGRLLEFDLIEGRLAAVANLLKQYS